MAIYGNYLLESLYDDGSEIYEKKYKEYDKILRPIKKDIINILKTKKYTDFSIFNNSVDFSSDKPYNNIFTNIAELDINKFAKKMNLDSKKDKEKINKEAKSCFYSVVSEYNNNHKLPEGLKLKCHVDKEGQGFSIISIRIYVSLSFMKKL